MWSVWLLTWVLQRKEESGRGSQASQETTGESLVRDTLRAPTGDSSRTLPGERGQCREKGAGCRKEIILTPSYRLRSEAGRDPAAPEAMVGPGWRGKLGRLRFVS